MYTHTYICIYVYTCMYSLLAVERPRARLGRKSRAFNRNTWSCENVYISYTKDKV